MVTRIFLIGYKSSGKSTIGRKLANKLNFEFVDLDDLIENIYEKPVTEIFSNEGESIFRLKEKDALYTLLQVNNRVISTGGGTPRFFDNMEMMKNSGQVIYLRLDDETLVGRLKIAAKDRPIVLGKTTAELFNYVKDLKTTSEQFYLSAHKTIDIKDLPPHVIVDTIAEYLKDN